MNAHLFSLLLCSLVLLFVLLLLLYFSYSSSPLWTTSNSGLFAILPTNSPRTLGPSFLSKSSPSISFASETFPFFPSSLSPAAPLGPFARTFATSRLVVSPAKKSAYSSRNVFKGFPCADAGDDVASKSAHLRYSPKSKYDLANMYVGSSCPWLFDEVVVLVVYSSPSPRNGTFPTGSGNEITLNSLSFSSFAFSKSSVSSSLKPLDGGEGNPHNCSAAHFLAHFKPLRLQSSTVEANSTRMVAIEVSVNENDDFSVSMLFLSSS
mmetsp:Transcript_4354/g.15091  ORF Transcript_4354/g.15091 Transcript_4354/m.15091 type:complete len:265 (+) Transcript_4354:1262-2056(+)